MKREKREKNNMDGNGRNKTNRDDDDDVETRTASERSDYKFESTPASRNETTKSQNTK